MIGRTIQNYRIEELLGEGGMGTVYRATDTLLRRSVAIKMLHPHLLRDATFMERFKNEAVLSAQLNHPNVAVLYNLLSDRSDNLMVMEYINGTTLDALLKKQGKLSIENTLKMVMQALDGLHHAHRKDILHRDIKPANLMLTQDGDVKLMDFGIARLVGSQRLTRADRVVGTLEYMAPELLDRVEPSVQSDLYAIGVLLYELLSGKMPFEATTDSTLINQILTKPPISLRSRIADLPKPLEAVLDKLFQKKPEKRYKSAMELKQALAFIVSPGPINFQPLEAKKPAIPPTQLAQTPTKKPVTGPTVLVKQPSGEDERPSRHFLTLLTSLEGLILAGAVLIAIGIVSVWAFWIEPSPQQGAITKDSVEIQQRPVTLLTQEDTTQQLQTNLIAENKKEETPSQQDPIRFRPTEPTPVKQRPPVGGKPVETKPDKSKNETPTPPTEKEPEKPKEETPKEEKREEPKAVRKVTVDLGSEPIAIQFMETITSDDVVGKMVLLQALSAVSVDGHVVIPQGAKVRGRITDARTGNDAKKAFLGVRFEAVQAANGEWVSLKYPEYSDKANGQVVFQAGRRVNNVRTTRTKLTVIL